MSQLSDEMAKLIAMSKEATTEDEARKLRKDVIELYLTANPAKRRIPTAIAVTLYEDEVELWNKTRK